MKAENAARKVKASAPKVLELEYDLSALPSSQHRAGLAGLALMVEWLERSGERERGVCEIVRGERTLRLRVDQEGLAALLDEVYAASMEEIAVSTPYKNKPPLRTYEQEVTAGH